MADPQSHFRDEHCVFWRIRVPKEHLGYLRFLLEAYEGVAQMASLRGRDEAMLIVPKAQIKHAEALLAALRHELGLVVLPQPSDSTAGPTTG